MNWQLGIDEPLVVGLGNPLMGDDGIGIAVARNLKQRGILGATVVEGGTPGFSLIDVLTEDRQAIFIDATDAGLPPGSVFWVDPRDLTSQAMRHSLHQITLTDVLELLGGIGVRSQIKIIGIQPERIGAGLELSSVLDGRLPAIVSTAESMVNEALASKGGESRTHP